MFRIPVPCLEHGLAQRNHPPTAPPDSRSSGVTAQGNAEKVLAHPSRRGWGLNHSGDREGVDTQVLMTSRKGARHFRAEMLFIGREDYLLPQLITEREASCEAASSAACLTSRRPAGTPTRPTEQKFKDNALLPIAPFKQNSPKRTHPLNEGETEAQAGCRAFLLPCELQGDLQLPLSPSCCSPLSGIYNRVSICGK